MGTYVMSDLHGCFDAFMEMLDLIQFSDDDQLIIAGDYVDRGSQQLEMLRWIQKAPDNVLLIKGNHDVEFAENIQLIQLMANQLKVDISKLKGEKLLEFYRIVKEQLHASMFDYYGTIDTLLMNDILSFQDFQEWKQLIDQMPYYFKTRINGRSHIIVHAGYPAVSGRDRSLYGYGSREEFYIYARSDAILHSGLKNVTVAAGHTPTIAEGIQFNAGRIYRYYDRENDYEYFDVDCGCVYRFSRFRQGNLACLRLEDREEFYI